MALGPLLIDLAGTALAAEDRELLRHPLVGGVVLFQRNFADPEQLRALCRELHALRQPRLLVTVDQEGGRVQRFRDGFTRLPAPAALGRLYDRDPARARGFAERFGWLLASELRACEVDASFGPVLDLGRGPSAVIGERALHADPRIVATLASAIVRGMHSAGMAATGKHFPGHGSVREDSHLDCPADERDYASIEARDLVPFAHLIRNGVDAIMTAHVSYPAVDAGVVCYSKEWLGGRLREQLGFAGAVLTDDLSMAGAGAPGDAPERVAAALAAGCDLALVCNDRPACLRVVDSVEHTPDPVAQLRRTRLHGRGALTAQALHDDPRWRAAREAVARLHDTPVAGN